MSYSILIGTQIIVYEFYVAIMIQGNLQLQKLRESPVAQQWSIRRSQAGSITSSKHSDFFRASELVIGSSQVNQTISCKYSEFSRVFPSETTSLKQITSPHQITLQNPLRKPFLQSRRFRPGLHSIRCKHISISVAKKPFTLLVNCTMTDLWQEKQTKEVTKCPLYRPLPSSPGLSFKASLNAKSLL